MFCKVYHSREQISSDAAKDILSVNLRDYRLVAAVYVSETQRSMEDFSVLEHVFQLTKSSDHPWWDNPKVFVFKESRSTSIGDIIIDEYHTAWLCEAQGWRPVPVIVDKEEGI
jgi:hypothetical protein